MPLWGLTVGDIKTQLAQKLCGTPTLDPLLIDEANGAIHAAYHDLVTESRGEAWMSSAAEPFTLVDGQSVYELDEDAAGVLVGTMRIVETPYTPLREATRQQYDRWMLAASQSVGTPSLYFPVGRNTDTGNEQVYVYPTPNSQAAGKTVSYYKIATPPSLWTAADETPLSATMPPQWHHYLVPMALTYFRQHLTGPELAHWDMKREEYIRLARRTAWPIRGWSEQREPYRPTPQGTGYRPLLASWPLSSSW
jgi:hypothetical protein